MDQPDQPLQAEQPQLPLFEIIKEAYARHKTLIIRVAIGVGVVAFIGLNVFLFRYGGEFARIRTGTQIPTISPTPTPTPIPFTYKGKMEFSISTSGGGDGPQFSECSIDPLDFSSAKTQTFRVSIGSAKPVTSASVLWETDNAKTEVPLKLVSGSASQGQWEGVYTVTDTAWYRYVLTIEASDGTNKKSTVLSLR